MTKWHSRCARILNWSIRYSTIGCRCCRCCTTNRLYLCIAHVNWTRMRWNRRAGCILEARAHAHIAHCSAHTNRHRQTSLRWHMQTMHIPARSAADIRSSYTSFSRTICLANEQFAVVVVFVWSKTWICHHCIRIATASAFFYIFFVVRWSNVKLCVASKWQNVGRLQNWLRCIWMCSGKAKISDKMHTT